MPDVMIAPVGDGPTLVALDNGFGELVACGLARRRPRLVGVQADRCQPLVRAWSGTPAAPEELDPAATVADGIAVLRPAIGEAVLDAVRGSGGGLVAVSERALLGAIASLAARAGVGAEPAGAAALAGLDAALAHGLVDRRESVVVLVTGREVKTARTPDDRGSVAVAATLDDVERALASR
jgi:threonine synthase